MASAVTVPDAPKHLDSKTKKKWQETYAKAHAQAKIDHPDNDSIQRTVANKEANKMLAVPAPQSADDIDALEDWQVLTRETRTAKDGSQTRHVVTADGRKYAHPINRSSDVDLSPATPGRKQKTAAAEAAK
jgi:hypothetical protein